MTKRLKFEETKKNEKKIIARLKDRDWNSVTYLERSLDIQIYFDEMIWQGVKRDLKRKTDTEVERETKKQKDR